jgi:hypothetical protein
MKMQKWILISLLALGACSGGGDSPFDNYKTPTLDNPQNMSADTLCYRAAYAKSSQALKDEVRARGLDCGAILESRATFSDSRIEHE